MGIIISNINKNRGEVFASCSLNSKGFICKMGHLGQWIELHKT